MMASVIGIIAAYVRCRACVCAAVYAVCCVVCVMFMLVCTCDSGGVICIYYMFVTVKSGAQRGPNYFGQTYDSMCFYTVSACGCAHVRSVLLMVHVLLVLVST
jgi:hypothetical protein